MKVDHIATDYILILQKKKIIKIHYLPRKSIALFWIN